VSGFYTNRKGRKHTVLTPEVLETLQEMIDSGTELAAAAHELGLKPNTVGKAMRAGHLQKNPQCSP